MSVLACDRKDCENVMCHRLILNSTAYICEQCWRELLLVKDKWPPSMTTAEVRDRIEQFMQSEAGSVTGQQILDADEIDQEFKRLTEEP